MIVKFNKFERVAGVFVLTALVGAIAFTLFVAVKKGWFASKVPYVASVSSAEGLHPGTVIQIAGLRAGEVKQVELISAKEVKVHFEVLKKFQKRIRNDSKVQIVRPFIIGEKVIDVSIGSEGEKMLPANSHLGSIDSFDMMDLVSGKKLGPFLGTLQGLMKNMSTLARAFADPKRTEAFVKMFDRMDPMLQNVDKMSQEIWWLSRNLNKVVPEMVKEQPEMGKQMAQLVTHLNTVSSNLGPAFEQVGPELPRASLRALEALDEAVIILKAMQKSFILSGKVEDVRKEEDKKRRTPANK